MKYGLLGYPLGHSLSPQIHEMLFSLAGKDDCSYALYEKENISELENLIQLNGFNVTIPHKTNILSHLYQMDEKVRLYQACNTVVRQKDGLHGYNTDVSGFLESLRSSGIGLKNKNVLVTGFGGVSKMMVIESILAGADVTVCLRNEKKMRKTREEIKEKTGKRVNVIAVPEKSYEIILQGTPCGMFPNVLASPIPLSRLKNTDVVFDTIYNPISTVLTNAARVAGGIGINGLRMLVYQAGYAQTYFYGAQFSAKQYQLVESEIKKQLKPLKFPGNIILIGPPGSGKSALMDGIAHVFQLESMDLDEEIQRGVNMPIGDIFASKGESYFRQMEKELALQLCEGSGKLISTGGGIVESTDCMEKLLKNPKNLVIGLLPSKEILLSRLKGDNTRPLLHGNMEEKLTTLLLRRMPLYQKYAHIPVWMEKECSREENILQICDKILAYLQYSSLEIQK